MIIRLFSGFETSLKQKWLPEGVPTIYKLLESLQYKSNLTIFFTAKDPVILIFLTGMKNRT